MIIIIIIMQLFSSLLLASSTSDISIPGSPAPKRSKVVNEYPNPLANEQQQSQPQQQRENKQNISPIAKEIFNAVTKFQRKQKKGTIDVWWLYDDGGLTLLLPYIISTRRNWSNSKLRVFALANKHSELEYEQRKYVSFLLIILSERLLHCYFSIRLKKKKRETTVIQYNRKLFQYG